MKTGRSCCPGLVRGGLFVVVNPFLFTRLVLGDSSFMLMFPFMFIFYIDLYLHLYSSLYLYIWPSVWWLGGHGPFMFK